MGFFTGSYILLISSTVLPMLGFVYWHDATKFSHEMAFNNATTAGCMVGMIAFGIFADIFGRRKIYGWEVVVLMAGTIGVVMSSTGYVPLDQSDGANPGAIDYASFGSMNIQSWLVFWRFLSGIGIGGEYPLSGAIASEFAPTLKRPRMLAMVFAMQAFGIAAGAIVSLVVTRVVQMRHPDSPAHPGASTRAVDQIWRWVIGLALVPALFTAIMRFAIPESPRYTLDVLNDPLKASEEANRLKRFSLGSEIINQSNSEMITQNPPPKDEEDLNSPSSTGRHDLGRESTDLKIRQYFWIEGNWRTLLGTSLSWFLLDFAIFPLGLISPLTLSKFWYGPRVLVNDPKTWDSNTVNPNVSMFSILTENSFHRLVIDCIPSLTGSILLVFFITRVNRRMLNWVMFLVSGTLLVITGITLLKSTGTQSWGVNILLYALGKFSHAFGNGPLTFLIPAELFPTKYRASCHGISAAIGKFGSLLGLIFLTYVTFGQGQTKYTSSSASSTWLSYVLIVCAVPMFLGAVVCWLWTPELQDSSGKSKTLEQLAEGRRSARSDIVTDSDSA